MSTLRFLVAVACIVGAGWPVSAAAQEPPASTAPADPNPLTHILQNLGRDLKHMASVDTLRILGAGGASALLAARTDDRAYAWSLDRPVPGWTRLGKVSGDGWTQGAIAVSTWAAGALTDHTLTTHIGSDLVRAQALNMVTTRALKIAVDRTRPSGGGHSFPSGHSSATFTAATIVHHHFGWKVGIPAYAAAGFVAVTRVADRSHWVSDTVFGAAMGVAAGWTVTRGDNPGRWTVTPVAVRGGGGLFLARR